MKWKRWSIHCLLLITFSSCGWALVEQHPLDDPKNVDFEAILQRRLMINGGNETENVTPERVLQTIRQLFAVQYANESFDKVPELQHSAFFSVINTAKSIAGLGNGTEPLPDSELVPTVDSLTRQVAALPDYLCWPVLRRILISALVQRRLSQGPFPAVVQAAITRLCARLFALHRQAAGRKGVIDFFHVSKAGGTTICQLAKLNGCRTQSFAARRNCLVREFDDVPRWVNNSLHVSLAPAGLRTPWFANWGVKLRNSVSCHIRKRFMLRRRFNIAANEFTSYGGARVPRNAHICPGALNILQLRHPHTRLRSHLMWVWALYDHTFKDQAAAFFPTHGSAHWHQLMPAATDNYYLRSMLGEALYYSPAGYLNETHLAAACMALAQFDVLMLLEEPAMSDLLYEMAVGWGLGFGAVHARMSSAVHEVGRRGLPDAADWAEMVERNKLDLELYSFGSVLARLDSIVFDVAREAGLGDGYASVAAAASDGQDGAAGSAAAGAGAGAGGAVVGVPGARAVAPGDDEQWEVQGGNGTTRKGMPCGFVSMYDVDATLPAWLIV